MKYCILPVTPFQQNCSLIWCEATGTGALIDPGGEAERLIEAAEHEGIQLEKLLLTHGHLDHVGAAQLLADRLRIPIEGPHEADRFWLDSLPQQSAMFGFPPIEPFLPGRWLADNETVRVGDVALQVLHCPGHTPGHVIFHHADSATAFVGDVLFKGAVGRTDFPRSDPAALLAAIRDKLWPLGDEVRFVPGHGATSTFGEERRTNPFLQGLG
jgi:hydroxyacylglutathione hydrolase